MNVLWKTSPALPLLVLLCGATILGCGSDSDDKKQTADQETESVTEKKAASNEQAKNKSASSDKKPVKGNTQKYVDGIPYDVFFDRPLQIAADNTMLTGKGNSTATLTETTPPAETKQTPSEPMEKKNSAAANWDQIIPHEMLMGEIKRLRNDLNSKLNSVGNFNRELISIQINAATLAAMAGIAGQNNGEFTWKDKAKYVRDLSAEIAIAAENRGRPAFEAAEKPFLNIIEILDGGSPAELPDAEDETIFSDIADRNLLMKNLKEIGDWIRTTVSNEKEMKSYQEDLLTRSALLAAIGQVVSQEDYAFADEENYQDYCKDLIQGSLMMTKGIQAEDYSTFEKGFELFNKSCKDCHPEYLNN